MFVRLNNAKYYINAYICSMKKVIVAIKEGEIPLVGFTKTSIGRAIGVSHDTISRRLTDGKQVKGYFLYTTNIEKSRV